jgi:hypothetical protein
VACGNTGGPSDKEAKEIIYGMYLKDAKIVEKNKCELTSWMEQDGQTSVWLVTYQFEGSNRVNGLLLTEEDGEWHTYLKMDSCPE